MSLGDFVKFLIVVLQKRRVFLPLKECEPWHRLVYRITMFGETVGRPALLNDLRFDWDGSYPKTPGLTEFLCGLRVSGAVLCDSPCYENHRVSEDTLALWGTQFKKLDAATVVFLERAADIAAREFAHWQSRESG